MSLFDHNSCCGDRHHGGHTDRKSKGCVCDILRKLANRGMDFCSPTTMQPTVRLVPRGTELPLNLNGVVTGTIFTVVKYEHDSSCVALTFEQTPGDPTSLRTIIYDCRCLCGVICEPVVANGGLVGL